MFEEEGLLTSCLYLYITVCLNCLENFNTLEYVQTYRRKTVLKKISFSFCRTFCYFMNCHRFCLYCDVIPKCTLEDLFHLITSIRERAKTVQLFTYPHS